MKVITDENQIREFLDSRYIEAIFPSKEKAGEILGSGKQLIFYWGIDPTGPDVHLGHTTSVLLIKKLLKLGHKVILLIGSFTAMIGDPTGRDTTRKVLSEEEVKSNMKTYLDQIQKILPKGSFEVKYNASWYQKMLAEEFIKITEHFTVQQMIARDMFQRRLKEDKPISLREFLYPVLHGYDSVVMKVDGEIGGNDQTFNMLVGRDLARSILGKEKIVITTKLLEDPMTGKKIMNKSEGQYISLNDSPQEMFGKTMAMPDSAIMPLLAFATELPDSDIDKAKKRLDGGENPKTLKEELAYELVRMYHGEKEAERAQKEFWKVFSEKQLPEDIKEQKISEVSSTPGSAPILSVLKGFGLANSISEAKRLIKQKAVSVNNEVVETWNYEIKSGDIIRVGPRKFVKAI